MDTIDAGDAPLSSWNCNTLANNNNEYHRRELPDIILQLLIFLSLDNLITYQSEVEPNRSTKCSMETHQHAGLA